MENWIEIDEYQEAVTALQLVCDQLDNLEKTGNPHYWAWIIIGLHNALQGYMVLSLRGTSNINVLREDCARGWLEAYERRDGKYPEQKLDSFLNLYKKIKSGTMLIYENSMPLVPSGTQDWSVHQLNKFRNEFIHFVPKGWSLEVSGLPQIVEDCLNIISFLVFDSNNIFWYEPNLETQTKNLLESATYSLNCIVK